MMRLLLILFLVVSFRADQALADQNVLTKAEWFEDKGRILARFKLGELLTNKQRSMIEGGFTTFSALTVYKANKDKEKIEDARLFQIRCSVKYDAWEEEFDLARLSGTPKTLLTKTFKDYASLCLSADLPEGLLAGAGIRDNEAIHVELTVVQTSVEEEQKIKQWLVQQQSGVMQTLFQHMLGELSLHQSLSVTVNIPEKPASLGAKGPKEPDKKG